MLGARFKPNFKYKYLGLSKMTIMDSNGKLFQDFDEMEKYYDRSAKVCKNFIQVNFYNFYQGYKDLKLFSVHFIVLNSADKALKRGILSYTLDEFDDLSSGFSRSYSYSL